MTTFQISTDRGALDVPLIYRFLSEQSTWAVGISRVVVERAIENSLCFGGYVDGRQVAFARVITDYATFGRRLDVPVLMIQGEDDVTSPTDHARAWLDRMQAPAKALVVIPGAGHQALLTHNAAFAQAMATSLPGLIAKARRGD